MFEKKCTPSTDTEVAEFERKIGYTLPEDLKTFLIRYNGGELSEKFISEKEDYGNFLSLETLLGIGNSGSFDFLDKKKSLVLLRDWMLPVGAGIGGTPVFVMDLRDQKKGHIYSYASDSLPNTSPIFTPEEFASDATKAWMYEDSVTAFFAFAPNYSAFLKAFNLVV